LSSFGKETALQAYKRGPPSLCYNIALTCILRWYCRSRQTCYTHFWWFSVFIVWISTLELI